MYVCMHCRECMLFGYRCYLNSVVDVVYVCNVSVLFMVCMYLCMLIMYLCYVCVCYGFNCLYVCLYVWYVCMYVM